MRYLTVIAIAGAMLAICGCTSGEQVPNLGGLPLVGGSRVVLQAKICDPGANAFCGEQLVVTNTGFSSSLDFLNAERDVLHSLGWTGHSAPIGAEHADDAPSKKIRVIFATAEGDLMGIDLDQIKRSPSVAVALAHVLLGRQPALSMLLVDGTS